MGSYKGFPMKKYLLTIFFALFSINLALAAKLTLINNFNTDLIITLANGANLVKKPDPADFPLTLASADRLKLELKLQKNNPTDSEVYFQISSPQNTTYAGFFGATLIGNSIQINGYISKGIAFSWDNDSEPTLIFCTHDYYMNNDFSCS